MSLDQTHKVQNNAGLQRPVQCMQAPIIVQLCLEFLCDCAIICVRRNRVWKQDYTKTFVVKEMSYTIHYPATVLLCDVFHSKTVYPQSVHSRR